MHAFTLTLHTHLFGKELPDKDLEKIAIAYAVTVERLMKKHGLSKYFDVNISWKRGSLLIYLGYVVLEPSTWIAAGKIATVGVTTTAAFFAAYKLAKNGYEEFKKDLRNEIIKESGVNAKAQKLYESEAEPPKSSNIIPIDRYRK
ncbi:hypothetical protein Sden_1422 [Shewanella denitrificans OS217]|uniref:Uncharacterized protein n=2 Tax=Shewanella TaxID=22 RepID=Q12PB8_SHEDO|nr:hypothetical protein Sden_1422 [Shewanella denitrificans OS217]